MGRRVRHALTIITCIVIGRDVAIACQGKYTLIPRCGYLETRSLIAGSLLSGFSTEYSTFMAEAYGPSRLEKFTATDSH